MEIFINVKTVDNIVSVNSLLLYMIFSFYLKVTLVSMNARKIWIFTFSIFYKKLSLKLGKFFNLKEKSFSKNLKMVVMRNVEVFPIQQRKQWMLARPPAAFPGLKTCAHSLYACIHFQHVFGVVVHISTSCFPTDFNSLLSNSVSLCKFSHLPF